MFRSFCTCPREARIITDIYFKGRIWEQKWINSNCTVTSVILIFTCLANCQFITAALSKIRHLWSAISDPMQVHKSATRLRTNHRSFAGFENTEVAQLIQGSLSGFCEHGTEHVDSVKWCYEFCEALLVIWTGSLWPHVVCGMAGSLTKTLVPLDVMLVTAPPLIFAPASSALSKWRFKF